MLSSTLFTLKDHTRCVISKFKCMEEPRKAAGEAGGMYTSNVVYMLISRDFFYGLC